MSDYKIGDKVIFRQVPPYHYDIPVFKETVELMERCLGHVFRIMDFDRDGQLELWVTAAGWQRDSYDEGNFTNNHTLWIEPECFEPFLETVAP